TAQETLLRLARSLTRFPNTRSLSVWLYRVAKSQCLMSRRRSKFAPKHMLTLDELMPEPGPDGRPQVKSWASTPEEDLLQGELRIQLEEAIQALPKAYKLVLVLRDMQGLDTRDVAEVMEISEDTVKMRLHRARAFVRNAVDKYLRNTGGTA
ncbi:MAG TPA: sigma-70 family RNA polymerase sigma factor, partial [Terriglobia bacterium]|nr:sigma-70 family RNA polymerase sigma factor [Terriglobia bacterium]